MDVKSLIVFGASGQVKNNVLNFILKIPFFEQNLGLGSCPLKPKSKKIL